jgi:hypothetical protein
LSTELGPEMGTETVRIAPPVPAARTTDETMAVAAVGAVAVTELVRFGPGVPAIAAAAPVASTSDPKQPASPRRRTARALSGALTVAIVAFVVWFLWPAGPLHARQLSVQAKPSVVSCGQTAAIVANVKTNGNPGTLRYQWLRGDGQHSGVLRQSIARGQHSANLLLSWRFEGPGTYHAIATLRLLDSQLGATVRLTYRCGG